MRKEVTIYRGFRGKQAGVKWMSVFTKQTKRVNNIRDTLKPVLLSVKSCVHIDCIAWQHMWWWIEEVANSRAVDGLGQYSTRYIGSVVQFPSLTWLSACTENTCYCCCCRSWHCWPLLLDYRCCCWCEPDGESSFRNASTSERHKTKRSVPFRVQFLRRSVSSDQFVNYS